MDLLVKQFILFLAVTSCHGIFFSLFKCRKSLTPEQKKKRLQQWRHKYSHLQNVALYVLNNPSSVNKKSPRARGTFEAFAHFQTELLHTPRVVYAPRNYWWVFDEPLVDGKNCLDHMRERMQEACNIDGLCIECTMSRQAVAIVENYLTKINPTKEKLTQDEIRFYNKAFECAKEKVSS